MQGPVGLPGTKGNDGPAGVLGVEGLPGPKGIAGVAGNKVCREHNAFLYIDIVVEKAISSSAFNRLFYNTLSLFIIYFSLFSVAIVDKI